MLALWRSINTGTIPAIVALVFWWLSLAPLPCAWSLTMERSSKRPITTEGVYPTWRTPWRESLNADSKLRWTRQLLLAGGPNPSSPGTARLCNPKGPGLPLESHALRCCDCSCTPSGADELNPIYIYIYIYILRRRLRELFSHLGGVYSPSVNFLATWEGCTVPP